jgi:DNA-binding beta-propeller fold protein YncE
MKRLTVIAAALSSLMLMGLAHGKDSTAEATLPRFEATEELNLTGTVEAIDLDTRVVTIKGSEGNVVTLPVGESVKNLAQVQVGDQVTLDYRQTLSIELKKDGNPIRKMEVQEGAAVAEPGEKPAAAGTRQVTIISNIVAIDRDTDTVTIKDPQGDLHEFQPIDPKNLDYAEVGDQVEITYTETAVTQVTKP